MRDKVRALEHNGTDEPEGAAGEMWWQDQWDMQVEQERYEKARAEAAQRHRAAASELMQNASEVVSDEERERLLFRARQELVKAADPLPERRESLERLERIVRRSCGRPAVMVRRTNPFQREKYHRGPDCSHISGRGRLVDHARWILIGEALEVGYEPCSRCRPTA